MGFSQFSDNFSDGNFTPNPNWSEGLGVFEVETRYKLHLIDRKAGMYIICVEVFSESCCA